MDERENRGVVICGHPVHIGPKPIIVQQVIGENCEQKTIDIHIRVPKRKPAIEQVIDVFVKKLHITSVCVLTDKVIVRGHFEAKLLYAACLPEQPVHAVEVKCVRFTADICIPGARCGMDADACAKVEYVDYECDKRSRAHWHKHNQDYCYEEEHCHCKKLACTRKCQVFVVINVCAKVLADREICLYPTMPVKPKG